MATLTLRRLLTLTCIIAALLAATYGPNASAPEPARASAAAPPACDVRAEMERAVATLDHDPGSWQVRDLSYLDIKASGTVDLATDTAYVSPEARCEVIPSIVNHEWMHLQQGRVHGGWTETAAAYGSGDQAELIADCGSLLLGSQYTPYVDDMTGERGCSIAELTAAQHLIDHRTQAAQ